MADVEEVVVEATSTRNLWILGIVLVGWFLYERMAK
jgi:hypothetical protein